MNKEIISIYYVFLKDNAILLDNDFHIFTMKNNETLAFSSSLIIDYAKKNGIEIRVRLC